MSDFSWVILAITAFMGGFICGVLFLASRPVKESEGDDNEDRPL